MPQLRDYQETAAQFAIRNPYCMLALNMGFGKSLTTLETLARIQPQGHILVIAPLTIARSTWFDEIKKWGYAINTQSLITKPNGKKISDKRDRLRLFAAIEHQPPTMFFINSEIITKLVEYYQHRYDPQRLAALLHGVTNTLDPALHQKFTKLITGRDDIDLAADIIKFTTTHDPDKVHAVEAIVNKHTLAEKTRLSRPYLWPFPTVIIDESQTFKSNASECFKAMKKVRPAISRLMLLTGTPAPNGLLDLWSQIYLLDQGKALGTTMTQYKMRYFDPDKYINGRPVQWKPKPDARQQIYDAVKHLMISVENTSLVLPDITITDVPVYLDADDMQRYKKFSKEAVLELAPDVEDIVAVNAAVLAGKLTQYASGTIYTNAENHEYAVIHTKKLEMTDYIIRQTNSPVIVCYEFVSDKDQLLAYLTKKGHTTVVFDKSPEMTHAWDRGEYPVMLLQSKSAGRGLNLQQGGHTMIWYTLPTSYERYVQTNARLYRQGQKYPVDIYRLITQDTYDQRLPRILQKNHVEMTSLVDAVKQEVAALAP